MSEIEWPMNDLESEIERVNLRRIELVEKRAKPEWINRLSEELCALMARQSKRKAPGDARTSEPEQTKIYNDSISRRAQKCKRSRCNL